MTTYETFVNKYHKYQYAPRTLSEAFRDADYASAIHHPPPSHKNGLEVLLQVGVLLATMGVFAYMLFGYLDSIPR